MLGNTDILTFALSFFILYFSVNWIMKLRSQDVFKDRLKELAQYKEFLIQEGDSKRIYQRVEDQPLPWLTKILNKFQQTNASDKETVKSLFIKAGLKPEKAYLIYGLVKLGMTFSFLIFAAVFLFFFTTWAFLYKVSGVALAALAGSYFVDYGLRYLVQKRQDKIRKAFPQALDLMVICTEAGLSLTATIQRVARDISQVSPDLGYELALLSIELNMFSDRKKALENFKDRLDSPYFKSIVTNIIQSEQYGTPIGETMRLISVQFREDRIIQAEEKAAKLPVKMSLPMMLFIFPCIYLVILGPAVINVMHHFN